MWFGIEDRDHMPKPIARGSSPYSSGFDSVGERWARWTGAPLYYTRALAETTAGPVPHFDEFHI